MALIHCSKCGATISDKAPNCPKCGTQTTPAQPIVMPPTPPQYQSQHQQTYQTPQQPQYCQENPKNEKPTNLNSWNWGAFTFGWLWGAFNGVYWPLFLFLVLFIPMLGLLIFPLGALIVSIILGINGNKMAWEKNTWRDAMQFQFVQRNWNIAAAITWGWILLSIISIIYSFIAFGSQMNNMIESLTRLH